MNTTKRAAVIGLGGQAQKDHLLSTPPRSICWIRSAPRTWSRAGTPSTARTWGGGCLADMGYHLIDLLLWYLGLPDRVLADTSTAVSGTEYDAEDTSLVHLAYGCGLYGSLLVSRSAGPKTEHLAITGPPGTPLIERGAFAGSGGAGGRVAAARAGLAVLARGADGSLLPRPGPFLPQPVGAGRAPTTRRLPGRRLRLLRHHPPRGPTEFLA
ncbi:Gfo/Idh/MocA family protein [Streptomyces sp. A1-5]|uniref:Gfo/Idh/MocA family protein n=1 Tax=Streptomyces sp. A1-5 TaxID=2738410 RepID=UPI001F3CFA48|nr:Gfo/Idh/MocA family oxidoreductase [Streptomyces sp. A1-5]UJB44828.1 hypothetical protein HRD51_32165 [Streptomyces sp. A1-5]